MTGIDGINGGGREREENNTQEDEEEAIKGIDTDRFIIDTGEVLEGIGVRDESGNQSRVNTNDTPGLLGIFSEELLTEVIKSSEDIEDIADKLSEEIGADPNRALKRILRRLNEQTGDRTVINKGDSLNEIVNKVENTNITKEQIVNEITKNVQRQRVIEEGDVVNDILKQVEGDTTNIEETTNVTNEENISQVSNEYNETYNVDENDGTNTLLDAILTATQYNGVKLTDISAILNGQTQILAEIEQNQLSGTSGGGSGGTGGTGEDGTTTDSFTKPSPLSVVKADKITLDNANTPRQLIESDEFSGDTRLIKVKAPASNEGSLFFGTDNVSVNNGYEMEQGEEEMFRYNNSDETLNVVAENDGDEYTYLAQR